MSTTNDWFIIIKTETAFQNLSPAWGILTSFDCCPTTSAPKKKKTVEKT